MKQLACLALLVLAGCESESVPDVPTGCNPLVGDDCLTPFPSSFYETTDATTRTGVRVQIGPTALTTKPATATVVKPDRLNEKDGFSPATPFLVYFAKAVDPTNLPTWEAPASSLTATGTAQVIDWDTGDRVLAFAEVDANAVAGQRQALIVRPLVRLQPSHHYIVALSDLKDTTGAAIIAAPFARLRDKQALPPSLALQQSHYDDLFAVLDKAGVARASLTLAWDVVIASDETATSHVVGMRDAALAMPNLGYAITSSTDMPNDPSLLKEILATVQVPSYLADDTGTSLLQIGPDGQPKMRAVVDVPVIIHVPRCAAMATAPLPTIVVGHGLFETAQMQLDDFYVEQLGNDACAIEIGTDWWGLAGGDLSNVASGVIADINNFYLITDRLQQAHLNAQVMTRTFLTKMKDDPALALNGHALTDGKVAYYFGISLGGIQGTTFMGLSEDIVQGALNVPGCAWSLLIFRSTDFSVFQPILANWVPDALDLQVAIASTQSEWDYTDAATFAPHLLANTLPSVPAKQILVQESLGDDQVTNVATRLLVRTMGIQGVDLQQDVFGVTTASAPLPSAYTQWNTQPTVLPPTSDTAASTDNGAHTGVYPSALAQKQIRAFLSVGGSVQSVCNGPCNIGN